MKLNSYIGSGANGKFSGGFDIGAFGGLQGGQKGIFFFIALKISDVHFLYAY